MNYLLPNLSYVVLYPLYSDFTFAGRFIKPYPTPAMTPIVKIKVGTSGLRVARQSPMQDTILPAKK